MVATLAQIRTALGRRLDDMGEFLVSASAANTVTITNLASSYTGTSSSQMNGAWLYHLASNGATQQRYVTTGGWSPTTGVLTLELGWTSLPAVNDQIKVTHLFPCIESVAVATSYRTLINLGLGKLLVPDRVSVSLTDAETASLATWAAWLDRPERLRRVLEPPVSGTRPVSAGWRNPELVLDGQTPSLEIDAPFTGTLTLEVLRPANTWIAVSSSWAESTVGLTNDSDQAAVSVEDAVTVALVEAYQVLMQRHVGQPHGNYAQRYADARAEAMKLRMYDATRDRAAGPQPQEAA